MANDMNLVLPTVSTTPGPLWATEINTALSTVSDHNHTFGNGAPIPSAALGINADLSFAGNAAINLKGTVYADIGSTPTFTNGVYVNSNNMYFRDGNGNAVQITNAGAIVGSPGNISGLVGTSAGVAYNLGTATFIFTKDVNQSASIDVGPITTRLTSTSSNGVTIMPAAGTTNWTLTLPAAAVSGARLFGVNSGTMSNVAVDSTLALTSSTLGVAPLGIQTANLADASVTGAKLSAVTKNLSSSCGVYSVPSDSLSHAITNLSTTVNLLTTRPLVACLQYDGAGIVTNNPSCIETDTRVDIYIRLSGANTADGAFCKIIAPYGATSFSIPVSSVSHVFVPTATGITNVTAYAVNQGGIATISYAKLLVYQL